MSSKQWVEWVHGAKNEPAKEVPKPKSPAPAGKKRKPKSKVHTAYDLGSGVKGSPVEPSPSPPED